MLILNNIILEKLFGLIYPNNVISNEVLLNQEPLNQKSFLQKKRSLENNNIIQKYENNPKKNNYEKIKYFPEYYRANHLFGPKLINLLYSDVNQFILGDSSNYCNFIVNNNIIKQNLINNNIDNLNNNLKSEHFSNYSAKKYSFENIREDININYKNKKGSFNEKSNTKFSFDSNKSGNSLANKKNIFEVTLVKEKKLIKKLSNKKFIQNENNKEIKVIKNKKIVYVYNSFLLNSYSKNIKKLNKIIFIGINRRGSKYRGVSKNGNQYQVFFMINKIKKYIGSYPVEEDAARIYDILTLKFRGNKSKTNFYYSYEQIKKIVELDLDIKNINQIISKLNINK